MPPQGNPQKITAFYHGEIPSALVSSCCPGQHSVHRGDEAISNAADYATDQRQGNVEVQ